MAFGFSGSAAIGIRAVAVILLGQLQNSSEAWLVERGRVGPITLGASAHDTYEQFRGRVKLVDLQLEGMLSPALELKRFGQQAAPSVIAELAAQRNQLVVFRVLIVDPAIRTSSSIGVGSTYADLRAAHTVDSIAAGEGGIAARVETLGASFELDIGGQASLSSVRDPARMPGHLRIVGILLTASREP